jgi:voltage-gated potassium channel
VEGDYTSAELLNRARITKASRAILLADKSNLQRNDQDRDARTILAALIIEKLAPKVFTCAELLSRENEPHLLMAGVEEIVVADEYSATILAASTRVQGVTEIVDEILSAQYGNQFYKVSVPARWEQRTFVEIQQEMKQRYDALAIAVEKPPREKNAHVTDKALRERTTTNPPSDYVFQPGDKLIVIAMKEPKL